MQACFGFEAKVTAGVPHAKDGGYRDNEPFSKDGGEDDGKVWVVKDSAECCSDVVGHLDDVFLWVGNTEIR